MRDDPFETLGLSRPASKEDLKAAFRTLAKKLHPDSPGGDAEKFKKVKDAYDAAVSELDDEELDVDFAEDFIFDYAGARRKFTIIQTRGITPADTVNGFTTDVMGKVVSVKPGEWEKGAIINASGLEVRCKFYVTARPGVDIIGSDVVVTARAPIDTLVLGGKLLIDVTDKIEMTIPVMTEPGTLLRARGRGLATSSGRGDLIVKVEATLSGGAAALTRALAGAPAD